MSIQLFQKGVWGMNVSRWLDCWSPQGTATAMKITVCHMMSNLLFGYTTSRRAIAMFGIATWHGSATFLSLLSRWWCFGGCEAMTRKEWEFRVKRASRRDSRKMLPKDVVEGEVPGKRGAKLFTTVTWKTSRIVRILHQCTWCRRESLVIVIGGSTRIQKGIQLFLMLTQLSKQLKHSLLS